MPTTKERLDAIAREWFKRRTDGTDDQPGGADRLDDWKRIGPNQRGSKCNEQRGWYGLKGGCVRKSKNESLKDAQKRSKEILAGKIRAAKGMKSKEEVKASAQQRTKAQAIEKIREIEQKRLEAFKDKLAKIPPGRALIDLSKDELRSLAASAGLPQSGLKWDLIGRLTKAKKAVAEAEKSKKTEAAPPAAKASPTPAVPDKAPDLNQPDQLRKYNEAQAKLAKAEGRDSDAAKWEAEAKKARINALKAEQKLVNSSQGELFGVEVGSSLPLFSQMAKPDPPKADKPRYHTWSGAKLEEQLKGRGISLYTGPYASRRKMTGAEMAKALEESDKRANRADSIAAIVEAALMEPTALRIDTRCQRPSGTFYGTRHKCRAPNKEVPKDSSPSTRSKVRRISSNLAELDPDAIEVDPKRFQYKLLGEHTKTGEVGSLSGVRKYDPNLGGILQVWEDPEDGKTYVVNGHNRLALAKRLGADKVAVRYLDAPSAKVARSIGALTNIAEGRGTSLDAAKFFRDTGLTRQDLEDKGIPMREKIASEGMKLSTLDDSLFRRAIDGDLPVGRAAIIGGSGLDHTKQRDLAKLIDQKGRRGNLTDQAVQELAEMAKSAESRSEQTLSLFGLEEIQKSNVIEKAKIQASIKQRLSREKKLFGTVSRGANDLARGGNVIDVNSSQAISQEAAQAMGVFDQMKNLSGPVSSLLNQAADRVANGENQRVVEREIYGKILAEIAKMDQRRPA